jgi:ubiquinone/menaquinone biosynthesis C-methylase UbiE
VADASVRRFYDHEYHFESDAQRPHPSRLWRALRELEPLEGTDFLDLGGGVGWAAHEAETRGDVRHAVSLDFSETAIELGRAGADDVSWVQGDGTALPFADQTFDRALSFGSLKHFPDVPGALRELRRVLRPAARAALVVPNFYVRTEQPRERTEHRGGWRRLMVEAGLVVERIGADFGPPVLSAASWRQRTRRLGGRVASLVPGLQYQFIFVVRRPDG